MSSLFDNLSDELFQILKGSGKTLTLYGEDGNKTYDPKKARRVFAVPGNLMVSVIEAGSDSEVKLYLSQSTDVQAIAPLIQTLRQVTTRYNVMFNVRKFGRELQPKDFAYQVSMTESSMYGSTKTSYQKFGPTKMIIRHTAPVREGIVGARGRNILSIFVETVDGERFKFPANHLSGGRAFAQHINQGGKPHDVVGTQITELALEALKLAQTARYIHHNRNVLGESALEVRSCIKTRVVEVRKAFAALSRPRAYSKVVESGLPVMQNLNESVDMEQEVARLAELLQIDSNHALAETLMPVALITVGENMTNMDNNIVDEAGPYDPEHGWDMDHQYFQDNPEKAQSMEVQGILDRFDVEDWLADQYPFVIDGDEKDAILDANEIKTNLAATIAHYMENLGQPADPSMFKHEADELFNDVKKACEARGYHISESIKEFASSDDLPDHHGIAAGDTVATFMGPATVISIEGDMASVEFLHGGAKTMHVDDLEKVPELGGVAEEAELSEWFDSFDPEAVLEGLPFIGKSWGKKPADPVCDEEEDDEWDIKHILSKKPLPSENNPFEFARRHSPAMSNIDEAMGKKAPSFTAYIEWNGEEDVEVEVEYNAHDGSFATGLDYPKFHSYGPEVDIDSVVIKATGEEISTLLNIDQMGELQDQAIQDDAERAEAEREAKADYDREERDLSRYDRWDEAEELDEISDDKLHKYFGKAASARGRDERRAERDGDEEAARRVARRDAGLAMAFKKMHEDEEFDHTAADSRRAPGCTCSNHQLYQVGCDCGAEEVIGGDQGQDLINDVKVDEAASDVFAGYSDEQLKAKYRLAQDNPDYVDYAHELRKELQRRGALVTEEEMFREDLERVIKNAMFRR